MDDLADRRRFYERQGHGVGAYFFDSLFADIDSLLLYAGIHPMIFGYHRMLAHRFPYAVYYRMKTQEVVVVRVLDLRQDPERIRRLLRDEG